IVYRLTDCGKRAWAEATARDADERNDPEFPPHLRGPWSKLRGYLGRLALVVHVLRQCWLEKTTDVDAESVRRAETLVNYFKGHARRTYLCMHTDRKSADAAHVLCWLGRNPEPDVFTARMVQQARKNHRTLGKTENVEECLALLERHGYVRRLPDRSGPGRPSARYERNPRWKP